MAPVSEGDYALKHLVWTLSAGMLFAGLTASAGTAAQRQRPQALQMGG